MTPQMEEQVRTSIAIEKKMMACLGRRWTGDLHHSVWNLTDDMIAEIERLRAALAGIVKHAEANGMRDWKCFALARKTLAANEQRAESSNGAD